MFNRECRLKTEPPSGVFTHGGPSRHPNGDLNRGPSCSAEVTSAELIEKLYRSPLISPNFLIWHHQSGGQSC
ncbi:hypothetical protein D4764_08G0007680 [Takifugu flavidus]|uniref:Uncharacterized protein n=1 Tax=Takifugu flavidus TaxID=433684 RepID=A0A5C6MRJ9_9TELE|nr:hypothetical protein D4764_08G0007680 [Takifugu flavidus]